MFKLQLNVVQSEGVVDFFCVGIPECKVVSGFIYSSLIGVVVILGPITFRQ